MCPCFRGSSLEGSYQLSFTWATTTSAAVVLEALARASGHKLSQGTPAPSLPECRKNVEYKYIKKRGNQVLQWQPGSNMQISLPEGTITAEVRDTWQGVHQSMSTLTDDDEDDETDEVAAAAIAAIKAKNLAAAKQPAGAAAGSTKAAAAGSAAAAKAALASEAGARASASASKTSWGGAGDAASHTKGSKSSTSGSAVKPQTGSGSAQSSSSTSNNIVSADGLTKTVDEELAEEKARVAALTVLSMLGISSTTALLVSLKVIPDPGLAGIDLSSLSGLSKLDLSGLVSKAQLAVSGLSSIPSSGIAS